ncbi:MAG: glycosyltransferase family 2 protein [Spirochaetales bacterium]|jgi:glycosyltransferase involved in cell wall biosynthesis|nr:glycosyltransferase family 2 protein [Spirochaetales bacterium]
MSDIGSVVVLLSSFNGEKFISEQLDSVLTQDVADLKIIIRDDGSSDSTRRILNKYASKYENVSVVFGKNIGVVSSFFELLDLVPENVGYVAFCDQDDVWDKDKLKRSIAALRQLKIPGMYCSSVRVVDENLNYCGTSDSIYREPSLENALIENIATGCTITLNNSALNLIVKPRLNFKKITMHDAWVYLVISTFGVVIYDKNPTISYRQHGSNVVGHSSGLSKIISRMRRHLGPADHRLSLQAEEFLKAYREEIDCKSMKLIQECLDCCSGNYFKRLRFSLSSPLKRQSRLDNFIFRILILLGRI